MKNLLSLILTAVILAASLASCAVSPTKTPNSHIRLTTSDASDAAAWLDERLGDKLTDTVVLGTSASGYALDVSSLEADGFFIRALGGEDVLFANSADGLDRAARKYAKAVERGEPIAEVTYHEGARIERLTIAGNDISEYAVRIEGRDGEFGEYVSKWVGDHAALVFSRLIAQACGVAPAVGGEAEHYIVFRHVENGDFKRNSYRYFVDDGDLVFEFIDTTGAKYGSLMFLEDQLGWEDLTYGPDLLAESDHIEIAADLDVTVHPMFESFEMYDQNYEHWKNSVSKIDYGYNRVFTTIPCAMHGMQAYNWSGTNPDWSQICYTNDITYQACLNSILDHIEARLDAGAVIGCDFTTIDVAQVDNFAYCDCATCIKVKAQENNAYSGSVVRWANRLAEEIEAEGYGGLKCLIFAYHGSNTPPVTAPSDDVWVTYVLDGNCSRHLLDGSQCQWESFDMWGWIDKNGSYNNNDYIEWLRGWCELSDNMYVWYYSLESCFHPFNNLDTLYEDFKLLQSLGIRGLFWQASPYDLGIQTVQTRIGMGMNFRPDMTKEEYIERERREIEREFGDGWSEIMTVLDIWSAAEFEAKNCWHCWQFNKEADWSLLDNDYYLAHWDELLELLDEAIYKANSAEQKKAVEMLSVTFLYQGCFSAYFTAYENDDAETMKLLEERYELLCQRRGRRANGIVQGTWDHSVYDDLHKTAWNLWKDERKYFFPEGTELKPIPVEYLVGGD